MSQNTTDSQTAKNSSRRRFLKGAGAATVAGVAGCTGGDGSNKVGTGEQGTTQGSKDGGGPVEFTLWAPDISEAPARKKHVMKVINTFEKEFNAKIDVGVFPMSDLVPKFRSAKAAGNLPHMVMPGTHPGVLKGAKNIADIYEGSKTKKRTAGGVKKAFEVWDSQVFPDTKGAKAVWPLGIQTYFPVVRKDWLDEAGYSRKEVDYRAGTMKYRDGVKTLFEDLKQTKSGQKDGYYPSATGMKTGDAEFLDFYIPQFGGSKSGVINEDGSAATIDSQEARNAIQHQVDFIDQGLYHPDAVNQGDEEVTTLHWSGKIADNHVQDTGDIWSEYQANTDLMPKDDPKVAFAVPYSGDGSKVTLAQNISLMFTEGAFKNDQKTLEKCRQFADFWASDSRWLRGNSEVMGYLPLSPSAIDEEDYFTKTQLHKEFWGGSVRKILNEYEFSALPAVPGAKAITYDIPGRMYQRILTKGWSVEKATAKAAEEINQVLAEHDRR